MTPKELLIFDLDNTLFDYDQTEIFAIEAACLAQNIPFDESVYKLYKQANNWAKKELPSYIMNLPQFRALRVCKFFELASVAGRDVEKFITDYKISESHRDERVHISAISKVNKFKHSRLF